MLIVAILIYSFAIILANLSVQFFGPLVSPINSFLLIGLDLTLRDWLHVRMKAWQMGVLIVATGLLTYLANQDAWMIAVASSCAFTVAALSDWATFSVLRGSWLFRSNGSNVVGAAMDSFIFPTLAFGVLMPNIVVLQFVAKIGGGMVWSLILVKLCFILQNSNRSSKLSELVR